MSDSWEGGDENSPDMELILSSLPRFMFPERVVVDLGAPEAAAEVGIMGPGTVYGAVPRWTLPCCNVLSAPRKLSERDAGVYGLFMTADGGR